MTDFEFRNQAGIALRMRIIRENDGTKNVSARECENPVLEFYDARKTDSGEMEIPLLRREMASLYDQQDNRNVLPRNFTLILSKSEPILDIDAESMGEVELHLFEAGLVKELRSVFHVSGYIAADPDKLEPGNIPDLTRHEGKFADAMEFAEFYGVDDSGERILQEIKDGHCGFPFTGLEEDTLICPAVVMNDGALRVYEEYPEYGTGFTAPRRLMANLSYEDIFRPAESAPSP